MFQYNLSNSFQFVFVLLSQTMVFFKKNVEKRNFKNKNSKKRNKFQFVRSHNQNNSVFVEVTQLTDGQLTEKKMF